MIKSKVSAPTRIVDNEVINFQYKQRELYFYIYLAKESIILFQRISIYNDDQILLKFVNYLCQKFSTFTNLLFEIFTKLRANFLSKL